MTLTVFLGSTLSGCIKVESPEPQTTNSGGNNNSGGGNNTPPADPCPDGTITLVNNSSNPYNIYFNGAHEYTMQGGTRQDVTKPKGSYSIKVEQESGYVLYPTVKEYSTTLSGCDTKTVSFP